MANISTIKVGNTSYELTPASHTSTATTYGAATDSNYGHVKLSDNYTSSAGAAASGIGASSLAVCDAYNALNSKFVKIDTTMPSNNNLKTFSQYTSSDYIIIGGLTKYYGGGMMSYASLIVGDIKNSYGSVYFVGQSNGVGILALRSYSSYVFGMTCAILLYKYT